MLFDFSQDAVKVPPRDGPSVCYQPLDVSCLVKVWDTRKTILKNATYTLVIAVLLSQGLALPGINCRRCHK